MLLFVLFAAINIKAQPPLNIYQTGANPTFVILQGYADNFSNIPIEQGDFVCIYFIADGKNYIVGAKPIEPGRGSNLVAFLNTKEDEEMPDSIFSGAPAGDNLYLCLYRSGNYYDVKPSDIQLYSDVNKPVSTIKALPLTIYLVGKITIDLDKTLELSETEYITWRYSQCPKLPVMVGETVKKNIQIHYYRKGKLTHKDGRVWETNKRGTISEFNLTYPSTKFTNGTNISAVDASGTIKKSTYTTSYKLTKTDLKRGYLTFKVEPVKYGACVEDGNPYYYLNYHFDTLPEPANPKVLIKEADPPPLPGYVPVDFNYDKGLDSGNYWKLVVKDGDVYFINNLNYSVSISLKDINSTRFRVSSSVQKATAKSLKLKDNDRQLLNKTVEIKVDSWQAGLSETKTFIFK